MLVLICAQLALQGGNPAPRSIVPDFPVEGVGGKIGSKYYIEPWTLETLVNEILVTPKKRPRDENRTRILRSNSSEVLRTLARMVIGLENAEVGIYLQNHDVLSEIARIAQRQFPWQRGFANAPTLYRSLLLYGSGGAAEYFERENSISVSDFVKVGVFLSSALGRAGLVSRETDLSLLGITAEQREAALRISALNHDEARSRTRQMRPRNLHTAYKPSILRDFPIIAFGERGERLRAPIPELVLQRHIAGLYLDVVSGGRLIWQGIGRRFEEYCVEYLQAMMKPYGVRREQEYGPKRTQFRTPDLLVSSVDGLVLVVECKAKRMTFEARFADDQVAEARGGYEEIAKGIFQLWRFFSHARRGVFASTKVLSDCLGMVLTADTWLTMARNQEAQIYAKAHALANEAGNIDAVDRRDVPVCLIDDVEYVLQHGNADTLLSALREVSSGEKKRWRLSIEHAEKLVSPRPYPFTDRIAHFLPWWESIDNNNP